MPNRIIREGVLDSPRYWGVSDAARLLFFHILLLADDFGLISLAPVFIRRRCFDDAPSQAKIDKLLEQLHDADLLRIYEAGGARYGFVPRFGQRLRLMRCKHPAPPESLYCDDKDAREKFSKNRAEFAKMPAGRLPPVGQMPGERRPEVEVEGKGKEVESKKDNGNDARQEKPKDLSSWAAGRGITRHEGETTEAFNRRAIAAYMQDGAVALNRG